MTPLAALLPPEVAPATGAILLAVSFTASLLTAALGLGGGILMLAALASLLPPTVVIPVHGLVQIGSNAGRVLVMRRHVEVATVGRFALGSIVGIALGASVVVQLPIDALRTVLALFILWSCWGRGPRPSRASPRIFPIVGAVTSFLTMFVGASGAFVAAFLDPDRLGRHGVVATHAACMTVQHGLKVGAFAALGFPFLPWLPFLFAMIGVGFLGTLVGRRILDLVPDSRFALAFRILLTLLALRLLWQVGQNAVAFGGQPT